MSQAENLTNEQVSIENFDQLSVKIVDYGEYKSVDTKDYLENDGHNFLRIPVGNKKISISSTAAREIISSVDPASILNVNIQGLKGDKKQAVKSYLDIWQAALYKYLTEQKDDPKIREFLGKNGSPRNVLNFLNEVWNIEREINASVAKSHFVQVVRKFQAIIAAEKKKEQSDQINSIDSLFKSLGISPEDLPSSEKELASYFLEQMNSEEQERKLDKDFYDAMDSLRKNAIFRRDDDGNLTDEIDPEAVSTYLALLHVLGEENMGKLLTPFLQEKGFGSIAGINQRVFSYVNGLEADEKAALKNEIKYDVDHIRNGVVEAKVDSILDQWRAESKKQGFRIDLGDALASLDAPEWLKGKIRKQLKEKGIVGFNAGSAIIDGTSRSADNEDGGANAPHRSADFNPDQNGEGLADHRQESEKDGSYAEVMNEAKKELWNNTFTDISKMTKVINAKKEFVRAKRYGSKKERRRKYQEWKAKYNEWKEWIKKTGKENFTRHLPTEVANLIQNEKIPFERRRVSQLSDMVQQDFATIQAYNIFMRDNDGKTVVSRENVVKYLALLHVLDFYYGRTGSNVLVNINVARWYKGLNEAERAKLLLDVTARVAQYRGTAIPSSLSEANLQNPDELKEAVEQTSQNIHYQENRDAYLKKKKELEEKLRKLGKGGRKKLSRELEDLKARFINLQEQRILVKLLASLQGSLQKLA